MKLHEREKLTREASASLKESMIAWAKQYGERLTFAEEIKIVTSELSDWILVLTKYAIRDERHGDTSKPGGLACLAIFVLALAATGCDVNVYTTPAPTYPTAQARPLPPARTVCYPSGQCVCYGYPCRGPDAYRRPVYSGSYPGPVRPARPAHTHGPHCHHPHPSTGGPARPRPQAQPAKRGPAPRSKSRARPAPQRTSIPKKARAHAPR
jgi:hypothetical protein